MDETYVDKDYIDNFVIGEDDEDQVDDDLLDIDFSKLVRHLDFQTMKTYMTSILIDRLENVLILISSSTKHFQI